MQQHSRLDKQLSLESQAMSVTPDGMMLLLFLKRDTFVTATSFKDCQYDAW